MSAKERREHLERHIAQGGMIMTARGTLTRTVPTSATLARTPAEREAAREDLERRRRALEEEERLLAGGGGDEGAGDFERGGHDAGARARGDAGGDELPKKFPGRAALAKSGITRRSDLEGLSRDELIGLDGVDEKTADAIIEALGRP